MHSKVFIALSNFAQTNSRPLNLLKEAGHAVHLNTTGKRLNRDELIAQASGDDAVIAGLESYDAKALNHLPNLKCISRCGVGLDNVDMALAKQKGIAVLNTPDVVIQPVAELTLAMIFDLLRKVTAHTELMRQNQWERQTGWQLAGKNVGVIGLGRIGRKVAELLGKLDTQVCGYDINPDPTWAKTHQVNVVTLEELLKESDIVTLHISPGAQIPFCLGSTQINQMKKGSFLINTARGALVDEKALMTALENGHLAGAALDVYAQEPYNGPLSRIPNVILTPHIATLTYESRLAMELEAVKNLLSFFQKGSS